jgi:hypothetical protein
MLGEAYRTRRRFGGGASDSGAGDSGAGDSGASDSGAGDSGAGDSGAGDSGAGDSGWVVTGLRAGDQITDNAATDAWGERRMRMM